MQSPAMSAESMDPCSALDGSLDLDPLATNTSFKATATSVLIIAIYAELSTCHSWSSPYCLTITQQSQYPDLTVALNQYECWLFCLCFFPARLWRAGGCAHCFWFGSLPGKAHAFFANFAQQKVHDCMHNMLEATGIPFIANGNTARIGVSSERLGGVWKLWTVARGACLCVLHTLHLQLWRAILQRSVSRPPLDCERTQDALHWAHFGRRS